MNAAPSPQPAPTYSPQFESSDSRGPLLLAVAVSVLLHAVAAWAFVNKPIGSVDPALLIDPARIFKVKRATVDEIVEDKSVDKSTGFVEPAPSDTANTQSLAELSRILLEGAPPPPVDTQLTQAEPQVAKVDETRPDGAGQGELPGSAAGQLPDDVLDALRTGPAVDLPFVAGAGSVADGLSGSRSGTGDSFAKPAPGVKPIEPFEYGVEQASEALDEAGFIEPIDSRPPPLASPKLEDGLAEAIPDRAVARAAIDSPTIDFAALALEDTKSLPLPEHLDNDFDYLLTRYKPPPQKTGFLGLGGEKQDPYEYFRVDIRAKRSLAKLRAMPKDVIYLIDTSGSVSQEWINNAVFGVRDALGSLNKGDRFNIVFFNESPNFFSRDRAMPADDATIREAQQFLVAAKSQGFTDVNRALSRLLVRDLSGDRVYYLFFISDGKPTRGVMDTREVINLITRDNDLKASIYCVGIGQSQNRDLLNFLAYRNKGFSVFADTPADAARSIRDLGSRLRYPIIKNVTLDLIGFDMNQVFPHNMPNIHQGETLSMFGRFQQAKPFTARLHGDNGGNPVDFTFSRDLNNAPEGEKNMPQEWAFWKLHHLYSEMIRKGETPEIRKQIDEIREKYKLKTLY